MCVCGSARVHVWTLCRCTCWLSIYLSDLIQCARASHMTPRQLVLAGNSTGLHSADFGDRTISTRFKLSCPPLRTTQRAQLITLKYTLSIYAL